MNPDSRHFIRYLEALKDSLLFRKLQVTELRKILLAMKAVTWPEGTFKNSSEVTNMLHFIVRGKIKIFQINPNTGREHTIFIFTRGDAFDFTYFLDPRPHDVYWEVLEELEILDVSMKQMRTWLAVYPTLYRAIFLYLGNRIRRFEEHTADITLHNTLVRLSHLLVKHTNDKTHKLEVIDNLSNDEIASLIGTTRAVVNRYIQVLKRCGAISVKRKHIDVDNMELLVSISEEKFIPE